MTRRITLLLVPALATAGALLVLAVVGLGLFNPAPAVAQEIGPVQGNCETRCRQHAQELLRKCQAAGGENCSERARAAYSECTQRCNTSRQPVTCGERCRKQAQELLRKCEAAGGENCAARVRAAYNECTLRCNTGSQAPCASRCQERAVQMMQRCEAAGGQNCSQRAREAYNQCVTQCAPSPRRLP